MSDRVKILWIGRPFLASYFAPYAEIVHIRSLEDEHLIHDHKDATFAMCMNAYLEEHVWRRRLLQVVQQVGKGSIPRVWWTIEDPNAWGYFGQNARRGDFEVVFSSDAQCVDKYRRRLMPAHHAHMVAKPYWLPLAASPSHHYPVPLAEDAADFVLVAQSYLYWPARRAAVAALIKPILEAGHSLNLFCPDDGWTEVPEIRNCRVGGETYTEDCSEHYSHGKIALGINCQSGTVHDLPYHRNTTMTSMRTFEALACGKPMLSFTSTAYERLGFRNGEHFMWVEHHVRAKECAETLLGTPGGAQYMAEQGRKFVLENHTYKHRLDRILRAIAGRVDPQSWQ